jgi:hypothetical protein
LQNFYYKGYFPAKEADGTLIAHIRTLKDSAEECLLEVEERFNALRSQAEECRQGSIGG